MVLVGEQGCIRQKRLYSEKVVVFGQNWLCSGKSGSIQAKVVVLSKSGSIRANLLYSGKSSCNRAKVVVFGQSGCNRA